MPTREYTEKERKEAEQAGEMLKKECGHSRLTGECLEYNEMCYFEDQEKCPEYVPKSNTLKRRCTMTGRLKKLKERLKKKGICENPVLAS